MKEVAFESLQQSLIDVLDNWYADKKTKLDKSNSARFNFEQRNKIFKLEVEEILRHAVFLISLRAIAVGKYGADILAEIGVDCE